MSVEPLPEQEEAAYCLSEALHLAMGRHDHARTPSLYCHMHPKDHNTLTSYHCGNPATVQSLVRIHVPGRSHPHVLQINSQSTDWITHASGQFQGVSIKVIRVTYVHQSGSSGSNVSGTTSGTTRGSIGVVNINLPWQHGLDNLIPWLLKSTQCSTK